MRGIVLLHLNRKRDARFRVYFEHSFRCLDVSSCVGAMRVQAISSPKTYHLISIDIGCDDEKRRLHMGNSSFPTGLEIYAN